MNLFNRIKLAGQVITKSAKVYGPGDITNRFLSGEGMPRNEGENVARAYEACAIAYACIHRIQVDAGGVPLVFLSNPDDYESKIEGDNDELKNLFLRPNPQMSARRLISWTTMMRLYRGECFWTFDNINAPKEIYPWFDPQGWKEKVAKDQGLVGWEFRQGDQAFTRLPGEVLWTGEEHPGNPFRGLPPLRPAANALDIDVYGDRLQADMLARGGERGLLLGTDLFLSQEQYDQLVENLRARRRGPGKSSDDFIIEGNLQLQNPDFTKEDIDFLAWQGAAKRKICQVYGMAPVMIGDDDTAQFKSAPEARKMYWQQTMVPLLHSLEDSWDRFFVQRRGKSTYVRFDLSRVQALQTDELDKARVGKIYSTMGIPLEAINDKLGLGFDETTMREADETAASRADMASLFQQQPAKQQEEEPAKSLHKGLTNKVIQDRALDKFLPNNIQRQRKISRLEGSTWNSMRAVANEYRGKAEAAVKAALEGQGMTESAAREAQAVIRNMQQDMGNEMLAAVEPAHREAAQVGAASVLELIDGKSLPWHDRVKAITFRPDTEAVMAKRGRYIRANVVGSMIDYVNEKVAGLVKDAGETGESVGWVAARVREVFNGWAKGQAKTIARTEVGTLYNISRFDEMNAQGFRKHEWVTAMDESTRDDDDEYNHAECDGQVRRIGETFSCGLAHPQEDGGAAGNVINCRCETIPVVED